MREIKLTVDGKEVQLTDEQIEKLGLREKIEPFKRIEWQDYYYMDSFGRINKRAENFSSADDMFCLIGNRCNDKDLMTKIVKKLFLQIY